MPQPVLAPATWAAIQRDLGFSITPAERRLIDKALEQIRALRELHG